MPDPTKDFYTPERPQLDVEEAQVSASQAAAPNVGTTTVAAPTNPSLDPTDPNSLRNVQLSKQQSTGVLPEAHASDFQQDPMPAVFHHKEGDFVWPHEANVPWAYMLNRNRELQKQRAEVDDAIKNFDLYAGVGKAPDPYNQNFQKLAREDMDSWLKQVGDQLYGGDTRKAVQGVRTDPQLNSLWRNRASAHSTVGEEAKWRFDTAVDELHKAELGQINMTPERKQELLNTVNGIGSYGGPNGPDVHQLNAQFRRSDETLSRQKDLTEFILPASAKALETMEQQNPGKVRRAPNGDYLVDSTVRESWDRFLGAAAEEFAKRQNMSPQEAKQWLEPYFADKVKFEQKTYGLHPAPGDKTEKTTTISVDTIQDPFAREEGQPQTFIPGQPVQPLSGGNKTVDVINIRNKDGSDFKSKVTFRSGPNEKETIYPTGVMLDENGKPQYIIGNSATDTESETTTDTVTDTRTESQKDADRSAGISDDEYLSKQAATTKSSKASSSKTSGLKRISVSGNEGILDQLLPDGWRTTSKRTGGNSADPLGIL